MGHMYSPELAAGKEALLAAQFRQTVSEFLVIETEDPFMRAAFAAAEDGKWGCIPPTGFEWTVGDANYSGPQHVTLEAAGKGIGTTVASELFDEDSSLRDQLLTSGQPFTIQEADSNRTLTVWQPISGPTGQWPLFRRFAVPPGEYAPQEIGVADYALAPYFRLPASVELPR